MFLICGTFRKARRSSYKQKTGQKSKVTAHRAGNYGSSLVREVRKERRNIGSWAEKNSSKHEEVEAVQLGVNYATLCILTILRFGFTFGMIQNSHLK